MSWRDRLRPASFRGVPFFVAEAEGTHKRRLVTHEYPLRDEPFVEDLGRSARSFALTGYVLGPNYFAARDALLTACEAKGPGRLVHPYQGTKTVCCASVTVTESATDGGMASFQLEFIQAGLQQYPVARLNPLSGIAAAMSGLLAAARGNFLSAITTTGVPAFVTGGFQQTVSAIGTLLDTVRTGSGLLASTTESINEAAALARTIAGLKGAALDFISNPLGVADALQAALTSLGSLAPSSLLAVRQYRRLQDFRVSTRDPVTPLVTLENQNRTATQRFLRLLALSGEAQALPLVPYASYEEAVGARSLFLFGAESLAQGAADDEFAALQELRAQVAAAVPGTGSDLPHLTTLTLDISLPALVVAHSYYGKVSREPDILSRNRIAHPGFVPAGMPLEVLSA